MDGVKELPVNVATNVEEAEPPTYVSPLLALLEGKPGPVLPIEVPAPTPELQRRIDQMEQRQAREVTKAHDRAYQHRPDLAPIPDSALSAAELGELNRLRAEWTAWHEEHGDTWRPDGGELDVTDLRCIGPADLLPLPEASS